MSTPTHEPPDPELWGRVVEIWGQMHLNPSDTIKTYPPCPGSEFWMVEIETEHDSIFKTGPTWNDAARAMIAEWEGRK